MRHQRVHLSQSLIALSAILALASGCGGSDGADTSADTSAGASAGASGGTSASTSADTSASTSESAGTTASSSPTVGPTSAATGAAFSGLDGLQISDTAKAAMLGLTSLRYQGSIAASDGSGPITLDLEASTDGQCAGQVGIDGGKVTLLAAGGQSYFKGDRKFWQAAAGSSADQIISGIGGRWVLDSNHDFGQFCDLSSFLGGLFDSSTDGVSYVAGATSTVGGQNVVAVERAGTDTQVSTGYVRTDASHYLVRIERTAGTQQGALDFSDYDKTLSVQAPDAADVVDPSTLAATASPSN